MQNLDLKPRHLDVVRQLLHEYVPSAEVWCYGSRVNGESHEASDLDLVLRNRPALKKSCWNIASLKAGFTESNLPFLVDVMDWARLPESFHAEIEQHHLLISENQLLK